MVVLPRCSNSDGSSEGTIQIKTLMSSEEVLVTYTLSNPSRVVFVVGNAVGEPETLHSLAKYQLSCSAACIAEPANKQAVKKNV